MKHLKSFFSLSAILFATLLLPSCSDDNDTPVEPSVTDGYVGEFSGTVTLDVAGQYSYDSDITVCVTRNDDETINVAFPEYSLPSTVMGDMTLGTLSLTHLAYDASIKGFSLDYGSTGIMQHFTASRHGNSTMDADYPLNDPSSIIVTLGDDGRLKIVNRFTLGAMPLPLTATFVAR